MSTSLSRFSSPRASSRRRHCCARAGLFTLGLSLGTLAAVPSVQATEDALKNATPWPVDDADPASSVPSMEEANKNPMGFGYFLMGITDEAVAAEEAGDWAKARRYYKALIKGAPDRAVGYQKVCEMERKLKDYPAALDTCFRVLAVKGVEKVDFLNYAKLVAEAPPELAVANKDRVLNAMDHFQKEHPIAAMRARCLVGTRLVDQPMMEICVPALLDAEKDKPSVQALSFAWQLEVMRKDWDAAQGRLDEIAARPEADAEMLRSMQQLVEDEKGKASAGRWTWVRRGVLGAAVLGLVMWWRRRKT